MKILKTFCTWILYWKIIKKYHDKLYKYALFLRQQSFKSTIFKSHYSIKNLVSAAAKNIDMVQEFQM